MGEAEAIMFGWVKRLFPVSLPPAKLWLPDREAKKYLAKIGSAGGKASALSMTKKQRRDRARKAAKARWARISEAQSVS